MCHEFLDGSIYIFCIFVADMAMLSYNDISRDMKAKHFAPIYFLYGEEPYFINALLQLAEQNVLNPGEEAFNKTIFYGKDSEPAAILDQVRRFPMMAERQLVLVKEGQQLKNFDALKPIFENPVSTTVLVIGYHKDRIDKRMTVFKTLAAKAVMFDSKKLYENKVPIWLNGIMKDRNVSLSPRSITLLIEYLGTDLEKLSNAVDKLAIASTDTTISDQLVEDTIGVSRSYNVFELQEAIGQRDLASILKIGQVMEQDIKRNPLQLIIPSLFNYISKLYMIKPLRENMNEIKKVVHIRSEFILRKYISASNKYSSSELEKMIHTLRDFDLKSKGVGVRDLNSEDIFRELILRLAHCRP